MTIFIQNKTKQENLLYDDINRKEITFIKILINIK